MTAYYNEIDPFAAQWLRELIKENLIAPGFVDERDIRDVKPAELLGYTQCHFFAGIGVWSYALRRAGFTDSTPVWTGSCPCQPFSAAGKGNGFADERHIWPYWQWLIQQCRPPIIFGEQVAAKNADPWIDLVQADVEAMGYAFGCVAFPAASVGAPHIRDRAYWVANAGSAGLEKRIGIDGIQREAGFSPEGEAAELCGGVGNTTSERRGEARAVGGGHPQRTSDAGATHWDAADWLYCRDGKYRPVEPGTFPLANGAAARVGRLRGYGNAIVAQQAEAFIRAFCEG